MRCLYDILPDCIGSEETSFGLPLPDYLAEHVPTGIPRGMISLLFAESGNFKTTIKANIVDHVLDQGFTVLDYSLEDAANLIGAMRLSRVSGIPYARVVSGKLDEAELRALQKACKDSIPSRRHIVVEEGELTPNLSNIEMLVRKVKAEGELDLVSIDYAQLIDFSHVFCDSADRRGLEEVVKRLQSVAKELNFAVLLVSQVSRERILARKNKRPTMKDLFGSSFLEFGCKLAIAAYRPWNYGDEEYESFAKTYSDKAYESLLELWIRKNRFGRTNVCTRCVVELPTGRVQSFDNAEELELTDVDKEIGY